MKKVITLGSAVLDIILKTKETKDPDWGEKIEIDDFDFSLGGGALNVAVSLSKLGLDVSSYFHLGKDFIGNILKTKLKKLKIKKNIFYHKKSTSFSIIILPPQGERIIYVFRGKETNFTKNELNKIKKSQYYYISPGKTLPQDLIYFLKKIKKESKLIAINPSKVFLKSKNFINSLRLCDLIFVNEEELRIIKNNKVDTLNLGKEIFNLIQPKILVVTLGERGSLTYFQDKIFFGGIFKPNRVIDKTGAGDAFASAFFGCLVLNDKVNEEIIKKAIIWGSANSSSVIQKLGAQNGILDKKDYYKFEKNKFEIKII